MPPDPAPPLEPRRQTPDKRPPDKRRDDDRLPRRDLFLLPLIFIGTILLLLTAGEATTRVLYPQYDDHEPCEYQTPNGARYRPLCTSRTKVWEGPWITQHFNACGYRTAEPCDPRPARALRVVVIGSSTARGALVNYDDSFAARASAALSARCGNLVDFQNLGTEPSDDGRIDKRVPEALALKPAAVVLPFGPFDLVHLHDRAPQPEQANDQPRLDLHNLLGLLRDSRLFLLMQYELYRDPAFQIRSFLLNQDPADYVRVPLSPAWQRRVDDWGNLVARITAQTGPAGVPLVLIYIPERAQAALATVKYPAPTGTDPYVLARALRAMAKEHGVQFVDSTPDFAAAPDFEALFYLTDGHPREGGHAAIAEAVEQGVLSLPAFAACGRTASR